MDSILKNLPLNTPPIILRYSFDHHVEATDPGEEKAALFYITTGGRSHYIKRINDKLTLKEMTFKPLEPEDRHAVALLDSIATNLNDAFLSKISGDTPTQMLVSGIQGILSSSIMHIKKLRPDLDVRCVNETGIFANAYPSTEDLIDTLKILKTKQS